MLAALVSGIAFGLAAGLSPGPFMALVVAQSVRYGRREGVKTALAPLVSDPPVIVLAVFALSRLADVSGALAWVSIVGGLFAGALGCESLRARAAVGQVADGPPRSLGKAIALNLLNPHVYVFWSTVGGPAILRGGPAEAAAFVGAFYVCLLGSKISLALAASRSGKLLSGSGNRVVLRVVGAILLALAFWLVASGVRTLVSGHFAAR